MTAESASANEPALEFKEVDMEVPSCIEIGLQAGKKGNFRMARQMLCVAMEQLEENGDEQSRLIELITNVADTYLTEGCYSTAKEWYAKALYHCEHSLGPNTFQAACLMARLAEVSVLESDMGEFQKYFEILQRIYLLSKETDTSILLNSLIDLSWSLCVKGYLIEVKPVNSLIRQIKQLEEEERLGISAA